MPLSAIDPYKSATVFASAGTGKTWLLVARLARLLIAGAIPSSILSVTFTKKAAGEMQERLLERLEHWAVCDDNSLHASLREVGLEPKTDVIMKARGLYEQLLDSGQSVRTTTYHSFCNDLLSQFPIEADIPPGYELVENTQELQDSAWESLMRDAREDTHPELYKTLHTLLEKVGSMATLESSLNAFFSQRSDWWAYTENQEAPLKWALEQLPILFDCDESTDLYAGVCSEQWVTYYSRYAELLQGDKASPTWKNKGASLQEAIASNTQETILSKLVSAAKTKAGTPAKMAPSKGYIKANGDEIADEFVQLHAEINARLDEYLDIKKRVDSLITNKLWYIAGSAYLDRYQRIKLQHRQLDFSDMEWQAYRLLNQSEESEWVQFKLDQRVEHLLIDEFQDTNPTQWQLLKPILEEFAANQHERWRTVFLVGDTKQSIYSFRRANPQLQRTAAEWLEANLNSSANSMDNSRRSSPAIMQAVNAVFTAEPFSEQIPYFQTHDTFLTDLWGRVEVHPALRLPTNDEPEVDPGLRDPITTPRPEKPSVKALEATLIAARIKAMIDDKTIIGDQANARPIRYGDIMILLRSRTGAPEIEAALRNQGIPYQGTAKGTLLPSLELKDIRALLKILHSPQDNLSLAQVLRSPLFSATDEHLVEIAVAIADKNKEQKTAHWFEQLLFLADTKADDHPFKYAANLLQHWQKMATMLPLHDLINTIYFEGDVLNRYSSASPEWQRPQVLANLQRLLEIALEIDSGRYPSMNNFLAKLDTLEQGSNAPSEPSPDHPDSPVRIYTIHQSKGLEAPVVFYADLAAAEQQDKAWGAIVEWPPEESRPTALLLQAKKENLDSVSQRFIERRKQRQHEEAGNLIYVALTRARQCLVLSASENSKASKLFRHLSDALTPQCEPEEDPRFPDMLAFETGVMPIASNNETAVDESHIVAEVDPRLSQFIEIKEAEYSETLPSEQTDASSHSWKKLSKKKDSKTTKEDALIRGNAIHTYLEGLSNPPRVASQNIEELTELLTYEIAATQNLDAEDKQLQEWKTEAQNTIAKNPDLFELHADSEAHNELPILYKDGEGQVYGIIDRLIITPNKARIIDYKTHRIETQEEAAIIAEDYRGQMKAYAKGVEQIWTDKKVTTELLFTAIGSIIEIT